MSELVLADVSRWYGNVVAVNDVTMTVGPGITGLLGPNGAGKSTLLSMMAGLLPPSKGTVTIDGAPTRGDVSIYRRIGLVPVGEPLYDFLTGTQFVRMNADLQQVKDPAGATRYAIDQVDMAAAADRKISTYSKGMRQRIKVASSLVHDPDVLLLDEPFNGMDPVQRRHMMDLLRSYADGGRTIVFSSHILEEVEQIARQVEVVVAGRHAASGDFAEIRRLMTDRPNQYLIRSSDSRLLATLLLADDSVRGVRLRPRTVCSYRAAPGPRQRHPHHRAHADRRIVGERLQLSGGRMSTAILRLGVRSLTGRSRIVLMLAFPVLLMLLGLLLRSVGGANFSSVDAANLLKVFGVGVVVPIVTLIATSTLISSELDDGSIVYLLSKPVPRLSIVASKTVVILATVVLCAALPIGLTGLIMIGTADRVALAALVGALVSAVSYAGIFIVLATALKRSVIGALVYWLVWESTLSSLIGPIKWLSARAWGSSIVDHLATLSTEAKGVPTWYAVLGMVVTVVVGVLLAGRRLSAMTLSDE